MNRAHLPNPDQVWPSETVLARSHRENMPRTLLARLEKEWAEAEAVNDRRLIEAERRRIVQASEENRCG